MKVIFLDYDGVVNMPAWSYKDEDGWTCGFNFPEDNMVNNLQAVQWLSEFCQRYDYSIVVSSTWRTDSNYKECLINAGLRDGIEILGRTPGLGFGAMRGDEISAWLKDHPEVDGYLIFDDDSDMTVHMDRLVKTRTDIGFMEMEFIQAIQLHEAFNA